MDKVVAEITITLMEDGTIHYKVNEDPVLQHPMLVITGMLVGCQEMIGRQQKFDYIRDIK